MTRRIAIINLSNWSHEDYVVTDHSKDPPEVVVLKPGEKYEPPLYDVYPGVEHLTVEIVAKNDPERLQHHVEHSVRVLDPDLLS